MTNRERRKDNGGNGNVWHNVSPIFYHHDSTEVGSCIHHVTLLQKNLVDYWL